MEITTAHATPVKTLQENPMQSSNICVICIYLSILIYLFYKNVAHFFWDTLYTMAIVPPVGLVTRNLWEALKKILNNEKRVQSAL